MVIWNAPAVIMNLLDSRLSIKVLPLHHIPSQRFGHHDVHPAWWKIWHKFAYEEEIEEESMNKRRIVNYSTEFFDLLMGRETFEGLSQQSNLSHDNDHYNDHCEDDIDEDDVDDSEDGSHDEDVSDKCDFNANAVLEAETDADLDVGDGGDNVPFGGMVLLVN
ncbi:unnamed protein product [Cylindrotheca closterium]|uniref:Uncharacterized protein n=1 Tax=Cylindrotheca closterium TaxID=2856 RepID=A0AAD2CPY2_9STRA|nr:unnamed protein product [Cylindrotheca closterium]